jgi:hypothetical protein
MAKSIASFKPTIEVPAALQRVFDRVIPARTRVFKWFDEGHGSDIGSNKRHSYFIDVLERASKLLRPLIPESDTVSKTFKTQNGSAGLTVEETDPLDDLIVEVKEKELPKVDPVSIEKEEEGLEDDFLFAIESLLGDIYNVRQYITSEWD